MHKSALWQIRYYLLFFIILSVIIIAYHQHNRIPDWRQIDTNIRYIQRLKLADDSRDTLITINSLIQSDSDISDQLDSEYDTILGIENAKNTQDLNDEYAMSQQAVQYITDLVDTHTQEVKAKGGIANLDDLRALDQLTIYDQDRRNTIIANLGGISTKFDGDRARQQEQQEIRSIQEHHHDHDHEHHHDHNH